MLTRRPIRNSSASPIPGRCQNDSNIGTSGIWFRFPTQVRPDSDSRIAYSRYEP